MPQRSCRFNWGIAVQSSAILASCVVTGQRRDRDPAEGGSKGMGVRARLNAQGREQQQQQGDGEAQRLAALQDCKVNAQDADGLGRTREWRRKWWCRLALVI